MSLILNNVFTKNVYQSISCDLEKQQKTDQCCAQEFCGEKCSDYMYNSYHGKDSSFLFIQCF